MSVASDRIEVSRARLRLAMTPVAKATSKSSRRIQPWLQRIGDLPLVNSVVDSVGAWWTHHPLRPVTQVANEASNAVVRPIAQRNPLGLVAGAALIGAAFAWAKPWRWMFRSALFAGLLPQVATRIVSNLPIESWMSMLGSALSSNRSTVNASSGPAPDAPAA